MRIYELARRYNVTSKEMVGICQHLNIVAKAAQSAVKGEDLETLTAYLEAGKDSVAVTVNTPPKVSVVLPKKETIVYVSTECQPFIEIGQLGEVTTSAVETLKAKYANINVFLPYSVQLENIESQLVEAGRLAIEINDTVKEAVAYKFEQENVTYYFIKEAGYFTREQMYGYDDDVNRFAFFSHAVLQLLPNVCEKVETMYVNEWHTSFIPLLMHTTYRTAFYNEIKTVLTVHSLVYQGWFEPTVLKTAIGISDEYYENGLTRMGSCVNILKSGIETVEAVILTESTKAQLEKEEIIASGIASLLNRKLVC